MVFIIPRAIQTYNFYVPLRWQHQYCIIAEVIDVGLCHPDLEYFLRALFTGSAYNFLRFTNKAFIILLLLFYLFPVVKLNTKSH